MGVEKRKIEHPILSRNLENISQEVGTLKTLFDEVYSYNITVSMSAFALSQTYLKKSESVTKLITAMGRLKDMVSESDLLIALRRRITQQNSAINKSFIRSPDELLQFFCENNTNLTWDDVIGDLIEHSNANTAFKTITVEELLEVATQLRNK